MNLNNFLRRIFRSYDAEKNKTLSPWRRKMLEVDERYAALVAARDNANDELKNKRQARTKHGGTAGVLACRDHGSVQEKLRKALGGKTMRRILRAERRAGRQTPDALTVRVEDASGTEHSLVRGVDFAYVPAAHGGPVLVLHEDARDFKVDYTSAFTGQLLGVPAPDDDFALRA